MTSKIIVTSANPNEMLEVQRNLEVSGHPQLRFALNGEQAIQYLKGQDQDLLIGFFPLEDMEPDTLCRRVRVYSESLILSIYDGEDAAMGIQLLNSGSDVCLARPFTWGEFSAQAEALIRSREKPISTVCFGKVKVDLHHRQAWRDGQPLDIPWREFQLLRFLIRSDKEVVSRERIMEEVWRKPANGSTRTVDQYIMKLRQLIEPDPSHPMYIVTVHGYGYRFLGHPAVLP